MSVEKIYQLSSIDPWFIEKINNIVQAEAKLKSLPLERGILSDVKKIGFSDKQIGRAVNKEE